MRERWCGVHNGTHSGAHSPSHTLWVGPLQWLEESKPMKIIQIIWSWYWILFEHNFAGGTFALYSLICRHAKVSLLPNRQVADEALSTYKLEHPPEKSNSSRLKLLLEKHKSLHTGLLILVLLGTCMVIGDGLLTPAISGTSLIF